MKLCMIYVEVICTKPLGYCVCLVVSDRDQVCII